MRRILSLVRRPFAVLLTLPWRGYKGLWWAFGDEALAPESIKGTLKAGFGSTLLASFASAIGVSAAADSGAFTAPTAWVVWGWITLLAGVLSVWAVKHVGRQQAARKPADWKANAAAAAAGFRDMGREVAGAAVKCKDATVTVGSHMGTAGRQVAQAGKSTCEYARRVRAWVRPRPS
ncbi:MAG TPA: hypothetical protein VD997_02810 [Phycisphaerales bacterium]|nr:hypothetical protein [Phycisphaerales bacterium]